MSDLLDKSLPEKTDIRCFWCRHSFDTIPIGCPIDYKNNTYITDGIFCSFNCCLSFINDHQTLNIYEKSHKLLLNMFKTCFDSTKVEPAPSWRILKSFGGHLTIDEFRDKFYKTEYISNENYINNLPKTLPIGWLFEERIKF